MVEDERLGGCDQAFWGVGRLGPSLATAGRAWEGDKLWILIINAASAPHSPRTGREGGKEVREVGGWEESMEDLKVKGQVQGVANSGELSGVWENSLEDVSKEMEEEERRDLGEKGKRSWLTWTLNVPWGGGR